MIESKDAAQLFTSQAIQKIAGGDYSLLNKLALYYLDVKFSSIKVSEIFDLTLQKISLNYRNEYIYKNIIATKLFLRKHSLSKATILFEFRVGKHKADCVIFNGHSTCYEIKTEFDNLKRLPEQLAEYSKVFDRVNVVCAKNHLPQVINTTAPHIGIIELTDSGSLKQIRKASNIDSAIEPHLLIQSLRRDEYVYIAEKISGKKISINNMEIYKYCTHVMELCDNKRLKKLFNDAIKRYRKLDYTALSMIPESLVSSILSYKINAFLTSNLHEAMNDYIVKDKLCIYH
ncbi:sce7726 family protein [Pseudescherichia vulneris]